MRKKFKSGVYYRIGIYYYDDEEKGSRNYDWDEMQMEFDEKMRELEADAEMYHEAWREKQMDYAMDNMVDVPKDREDK